MTYVMVYNGELYHHGIKGQKWGIRRYQNEDGTLTDAGRKRYGEHGSDYLQSRSNLKAAEKAYSKKKFVGNLMRTAGKSVGPYGGLACDLAGNLYERESKKKYKEAKRDYTIKRHDMLQETGRRKALKGPVQTKGEDEADFGYRGAKRIAKRQNNKGMTRTQAVKREKIRKGIKTVASLSVAAIGAYDQATGGAVSRKVLKTGLKVAEAGIRSAKAAKNVWNDYYNTSILDASGKVIMKYHDSTNFGEDVARALLSA